MKSYSEKAVQSGNVIELSHYERPIYKEYNLLKLRKHEGRRKKATEENKKENRKKVCNRAKKTIERLINCNVCEDSKFLTLTFSENITKIKDANKEFKKFIRKLKNYFKLELKYLCVPELTKKGCIHYHVVLFNLPFVKRKTLDKFWEIGFTKIKKIMNKNNVGACISNYLTKDNTSFQGKKSYFSSKNLKKPIEITDEEEIKMLKESLVSEDIVWTGTFNNEYLGLIEYTVYIIDQSWRKKSYKRGWKCLSNKSKNYTRS